MGSPRPTTMSWRRSGSVWLLALLLTGVLAPPAGAREGGDYEAALLTWHTPGDFEVSHDGNPINAAGQVAGSVVVNSQHRAAVLNTRTGAVHLLNGLDPACESWAVDTNVRAHVAGYVKCADGWEVGFLWTSRTTAVRPITTAPQTNSRAYAMNDFDVVVGTFSSVDTVGNYAYTWSAATGTLRPLPRLGGLFGTAYAVNNGGYVTGTSANDRGQYRPFVYLPRTQVVSEIGTPPRWNYAAGYGINDKGYVVGGYSEEVGGNKPFVWSPVTRTVQPMSEPADAYESAAVAINQGGVVVGRVGSGVVRSLVWDTCGGPPRPLPPLPGSTDDQPYGINAYGRVVGMTTTGSPVDGWTFRGTMWDRPPADRGAVKLPCRS